MTRKRRAATQECLVCETRTLTARYAGAVDAGSLTLRVSAWNSEARNLPVAAESAAPAHRRKSFAATCLGQDVDLRKLASPLRVRRNSGLLMRVDIRPFEPADIEALYEICLLTGWRGADATGLYSDPTLLGHFYAAPYAAHDPSLCLIATLEGRPSGYILGTADSAAFRAWSEAHWFPAIRQRYPLPDLSDGSANATLLRNIHAGYQPPSYSRDYPAHLHIDLLPCIQGRGIGARLMNRFLDLLRNRDCPAVHLVVNKANSRAVAFYGKFGFHLIVESPNHEARGFALR